MIDSILSNLGTFRWVLFLGVIWAFYRWMQSDDSEGIEWRDFFATVGTDGNYHGDWNRVGQCAGVLVCVYSVIYASPNAHKDFTGFALVLTSCLAFLGGVAGYAAFLRSKRETVTTVTEPVAEPMPTKTTVTEPLPVAEKKAKQ